MSNTFPFQDDSQLQEWHTGIKMANRNNIFCHCRSCGYEWVDSSTEVVCTKCGSKDIEYVCCWQFPDG